MSVTMCLDERLDMTDRLILGLEAFPWDICYRTIIGWALMPAFYRLGGARGATWKLTLFFLLVLALMRVAPGVFRRFVPFSAVVRSVWAERRTLAKRYDSYQWRKLFGLGLGWNAYFLFAGSAWPGSVAIASLCLASGIAGAITWAHRSKGLPLHRIASGSALPPHTT